MTAQSIYRLRCDAPRCPYAVIVEQITAVPDGWRRVSSGDHLADWKSGQRRKTATGRSYTDKRTVWDLHAGSFTLHLCPDHPTVFDAHLPQTEGHVVRSREGNRHVEVRCSCGLSTTTYDIRWVGRDPMPNGNTERVWWQHLPEDLRWYATREAS